MREECAAPPPCAAWVDELRSHPVTLRLYLVDHMTRAPAAQGDLFVEVRVDAQVVGEVTIPADPDAPHVFPVTGPVVTPGLHEVAVRARGPLGALEQTAIVSLPAFDVQTDGRAALGAEVVVELADESVSILPPQVYPPRF